MSSQVASPSNLSGIQTNTHRPIKPQHDWSAFAVVLLSRGSFLVLVGGLMWWGLQGKRTISSQPTLTSGSNAANANRMATDRKQSARPKPADQGTSRSSGSRESVQLTIPTGISFDSEETSRWAEKWADKAAAPWVWQGALTMTERQTARENPFESDAAVEAQNTLDDLVFKRLIKLNIKSAKLCSDEVFLRRAYVDTIGTLPTVEEAKQFLDDPNPVKRAALIDHLLQRPEFADYWAMKWCDILRVKAEFPIKLWPNAAQAYHRWIRTSIKHNLPYDVFARELLTASGSNFRTPQVNFYRAVQSKEPKAIAQAVALTFLCERADAWPAYRLEGMSAFFSQVGYKPTGEWKEEIVYFDPRKGQAETGNGIPTAVFPNGAAVRIAAGQDPRQVFADWLVNAENPWFTRAIANRVWCWLLGRGIVDPPDDVRPENPASNLALLNHLADELISANYDLRHLYRLILNSTTYQLASIFESQDSRAGDNFAYYPARRLEAEVLIDGICQITGTTEMYSSIIPEPFTFLPNDQRAIALPDGSITSSFLEMFGRPPRDTGLESDRNNRFTAAQALHLLNSNHLRNKLKQGSGIKDLLRQAVGATDTAELLYLAILSRRPTESELEEVVGLCASANGARDVAWALINTDEFLFRH